MLGQCSMKVCVKNDYRYRPWLSFLGIEEFVATLETDEQGKAVHWKPHSAQNKFLYFFETIFTAGYFSVSKYVMVHLWAAFVECVISRVALINFGNNFEKSLYKEKYLLVL